MTAPNTRYANMPRNIYAVFFIRTVLPGRCLPGQPSRRRRFFQIVFCNSHQIVPRRAFDIGDPVGVHGHDVFKEITHVARVAEIIVSRFVQQQEIVFGKFPGVFRQHIFVFLAQQVENGQQFAAIIIFEEEIAV